MSAANIVQYVIVRGDLLKALEWPAGAVIAQACHAVTAVTHLFYEDEFTQRYLKDLDNMHKVVLEAPDEKSLVNLKEKLEENSVKHKLWIEQPENIPTCLVVKPYPKEEIQKYFKRFKLFKT
ncbi:putative peptidyl-tRNA hydrolase PTRHD1 [Diabrotica undecimpunctata]|uniref:putative peptidyl-tRNA hydrolase PTRHD1 n=1 Tax=Diabrotica undecimpunctata TaxID=50387 RepID=UPI003B6395CD